MEILRKISHTIVVGLLGFILAVGIIASTISLTLTSADTVKSWPVEAGIYSKITDQILNATNRANAEGPAEEEAEELERTLEDSPLDRERLERAVGSVFTAEYWQNKFETVIDSFYGWLDGSYDSLEFEIAFNDKNEELAAAMETELAEQLTGYPRCGANVSFNNFDPITASCLPRGVTAEEAASEFASQLKEDDFLADARISSQEMEIDQDFIDNGPRAYSTVKSLPLIFSLLVLVLAALAVFSSKSRLRGLRKTGQLLFSIGLLSWLSFFIGNKIGAKFELVRDPGNPNEEIFAELGQPLIKAALDDLTTTGLWVALTVVLVGALMWLGAFMWHKAHHHNEAELVAKRAAEQKSQPDPKLPKPIKPGKD